MARKKCTPEESARREKIRELLQLENIGSMEDIQSLFKETIAGFMEAGLELRKVTKAKSVFPTDDSLLKMLYLAMVGITRKWTGRREWSQIHAQLTIFFAERMPE